MRAIVCVLAILVSGCASNEFDATNLVTRDADQIRVKPDARLLEKCAPITDKLKTGNEEAVVVWSDSVLSQAADCRKKQWAVIDWVKKIFKID